MKCHWSRIGICTINILVGIFLAQIPIFILFARSNVIGFLTAFSLDALSQTELCDQAKLFTVKVLGGEIWGSGILITQHGTRYSLITNGHVLKGNQERYQIQTHDGQTHSAFVFVRFDHGKSTGNDLAILQFNSPIKKYELATLDRWSDPEQVMAAGFPVQPDPNLSDNQGFMCTVKGDVFRRLEKPMQNGYQLGYFVSVRHGMSGGPLLNDRGRVVGINGMAEPIFMVNPDIYQYRDGSRVSASLGMPPDRALEQLASSSWSIPAETMVYLSPKGLNLNLASGNAANLVDSESTEQMAASPDFAHWPSAELEIAKNFTVLIGRPSTARGSDRKITLSGSGAIVAKNNQTYQVLTAESVVRPEADYQVMTFPGTTDETTYKAKVIERRADIGLALLEFTADRQQYTTATIADTTNLAGGIPVYISGWFSDLNGNLDLTVIEGELVDAKRLGLGSNLIYTNRTPDSMRGGAILNQSGQLIGIHQGLRPEGGIREGIPSNSFRLIAPDAWGNAPDSSNGGSCNTVLFGSCAR